ncbi:hypothetical protein L2E82_37474 [Cichorium intybus]|uniref:Uncharacterized protein n=1 Tax=Cichorium intybus TaxID=13427 RepID=A0ACB9ADL7_CICIN|nr:hypothetical protein L2E82_37474 [Cichorium intybus]
MKPGFAVGRRSSARKIAATPMETRNEEQVVSSDEEMISQALFLVCFDNPFSPSSYADQCGSAPPEQDEFSFPPLPKAKNSKKLFSPPVIGPSKVSTPSLLGSPVRIAPPAVTVSCDAIETNVSNVHTPSLDAVNSCHPLVNNPGTEVIPSPAPSKNLSFASVVNGKASKRRVPVKFFPPPPDDAPVSIPIENLKAAIPISTSSTLLPTVAEVGKDDQNAPAEEFTLVTRKIKKNFNHNAQKSPYVAPVRTLPNYGNLPLVISSPSDSNSSPNSHTLPPSKPAGVKAVMSVYDVDSDKISGNNRFDVLSALDNSFSVFSDSDGSIVPIEPCDLLKEVNVPMVVAKSTEVQEKNCTKLSNSVQ